MRQLLVELLSNSYLGPSVWKCWRSKFDTRTKCNAVGGSCVDDASIANNFAHYFSLFLAYFYNACRSFGWRIHCLAYWL